MIKEILNINEDKKKFFSYSTFKRDCTDEVIEKIKKEFLKNKDIADVKVIKGSSDIDLYITPKGLDLSHLDSKGLIYVNIEWNKYRLKINNAGLSYMDDPVEKLAKIFRTLDKFLKNFNLEKYSK